jgi:hypothetical protein
MRFSVDVEKRQTVRGTISIEATTAAAAIRALRDMMANEANPLQSTDPRIVWYQTDYDDDSFKTYGGVQVVQ